jgi:hypothetical protein
MGLLGITTTYMALEAIGNDMIMGQSGKLMR